MSEVILPLGLRHAIESGECVLFVGAGIGAHLNGRDGSPAPDGESLAKQLAKHFGIETESYELAKIAQVVALRKGRVELEAFIRKQLESLQPDETLKWLMALRWRAIFTTNYDHGIQRAYDLISNPQQKPVTIAATSELIAFDPRFEVPVYHLHGTLFGTSKPEIVITDEDYAKFRERRRMLFELLKKEFATSNFLYIGYSNRDPNWKLVLSELFTEFLPSAPPSSYRVTRSTDPLDIEILKSQNIETISASIEEFVAAAASALSEIRVDPDRINKLKHKIPSELIPAFDKNPAATTRLLSSWTYANQAPFDETPNTGTFLKGDRPNWGLIGRKQYFERDVEEQAYEDILDYATSSSKLPKIFIVLGPAGYGASTLLMSVAAKLVNERAGPVFFQKEHTHLREGDIEFAMSLFQGVPFFFIDNASDNRGTISTLFQGLKEARTPACFVLGERLNEWRQDSRGPTGEERLLEPLSDSEINRLLKFLEENNALGVLRDLDQSLRFAAIKEKYNKELLVAMREATEGRAFDAILEDEYRGLANDISRKLYLTVSCIHQHGAFARDTLLADLLGMPLADLYSATGNATEGVVIFETADEAYGHYLARTRHRTIAGIIWERSSVAAEREQLLLTILNALNFSYFSDRETFQHFIRSDRMVDTIRSLDGKIKFFESACKKDPDNQYVRQHYARMLLREQKPDLALGQIELALKIDSSAKVLHHTKALALRDLALGIASPDIALRKLAQSESEFRRCIAIHNRDGYSYQGLADLYLGWAKRALTDDEAASYIAKAEETINEGLRVVRLRDGLWLVSSEVQKLLGDQPSRLKAIERAVADNPESIVASHLLGRAYRKAGKLGEARAILHKLVGKHPEEFRACVEYARTLHELGEPYSKSIAVLRLSMPYGLLTSR